MSDFLRTFLALTPPLEILDQIDIVIDELENLNLPFRWERKDKLHLTLKFLGKTRTDQIEEILELGNQVARNYKPFQFKSKKITGYPSLRKARVLVLEFTTSPEIFKMRERLEDGLFKVGFKKENRFSPHLTLGRSSSGRKINLGRAIGDFKLREDICFKIDHLDLYRSILTPRGSKYKILDRMAFKRD